MKYVFHPEALTESFSNYTLSESCFLEEYKNKDLILSNKSTRNSHKKNRRMIQKPLENNTKPNKTLDNKLFAVVTTMVFFVMTMLGINLHFQYSNYKKGIELVEDHGSSRPSDHATLLTYSRAWDFAVVKTSTLFLAFMLIFLGALYILRVAEVSYSLSIASPESRKISFSTASPGLVLVTLGTIVVIILLFSKSSINYDVQAPIKPEDHTDGNIGIPFNEDALIKQPDK